jgi:hypothetical protein
MRVQLEVALFAQANVAFRVPVFPAVQATTPGMLQIIHLQQAAVWLFLFGPGPPVWMCARWSLA